MYSPMQLKATDQNLHAGIKFCGLVLEDMSKLWKELKILSIRSCFGALSLWKEDSPTHQEVVSWLPCMQPHRKEPGWISRRAWKHWESCVSAPLVRKYLFFFFEMRKGIQDHPMKECDIFFLLPVWWTLEHQNCSQKAGISESWKILPLLHLEKRVSGVLKRKRMILK